MKIITLSLALAIISFGCTHLEHFKIPVRTFIDQKNINSVSVEAKLQDITDTVVNENKLIGVQVSIKYLDGNIWNGASGTIDLERMLPMTTDHLIRIGSLTKTYTAVLIFRLIEKGIISLDDNINKWFPEYNYGNLITVRMLLNHSSGVPELLGMKAMFVSSLKSQKRWSEEDLLDLILDEKLDFDPGTDMQYSNSNYVLLGILAERSTGKSLHTLYSEEIFGPLSLMHTYFLPADSIPHNLVTGYDRDLIPLPGWHTTEPENTAWSSCAYSSGGMAASASDVLIFLDAIQKKRIINTNSYDLMTQFVKSKNPKDKYLENFGMGLFKFGDYYEGAIGHLGLFVGSEAIGIYSLEKKFIIVVLANVSRIINSDALIRKYLNILLN